MEGEKFHIYLVDDAVPFCVKTPRAIPFAYRNKLKAELDIRTPRTGNRMMCIHCGWDQRRVQTGFGCVWICPA